MPEDLNHIDHVEEAREPADPQAVAALGREVRFGLTLIGLLLATLAAALYIKLGKPHIPGLPWGKHEVASADAGAAPEGKTAADSKARSDAAAASPAMNPFAASAASEPAMALPVEVLESSDASSGQAPAAGDRYAGRYGLESPPSDPPFPIGGAAASEQQPAEGVPLAAEAGGLGNEIPPADSAANDSWSATEAPPFNPSPSGSPRVGNEIERVGATTEQFGAPTEADLPSEPPAFDGPLVPAAEVDLQQPASPSGSVQPAGAREPTLAPPRNAPYGRPTAGDRYATGAHTNSYDSRDEEGPRAAPSTEHTPLHAPPAHSRDAAGSGRGGDPFNTPLERDLQSSRTPHYNTAPHTPPPTNALDAPVSEFAAPQDDLSRHHHTPAHVPTPDGTYEVMPNDSFWTISQKVYGTPGFFKAIQRHNRQPGQQAEGLEIGEKILVPPVEVLEQKYPQLCPKRRTAAAHGGRMISTHAQANTHSGRIYIVEQGDTLFDIARFELGKASRWAEIYEMNRGQLGNDYDYIAPGTRLMLPDTASNEPEPITTRPVSPYAR